MEVGESGGLGPDVPRHVKGHKAEFGCATILNQKTMEISAMGIILNFKTVLTLHVEVGKLSLNNTIQNI